MATPLSSLTRHGGVVIGLMCLLMFAFVIGDALQFSGDGGGGRSGGGDVVATWGGGQINERQLDQAVYHRNVLAEFQQQVYVAGTRDAMEDGVEDLGLRVREIALPRTREQGVERSVVRTKIFAEKARQAGMVVSDDMVVDYLRALGRDRVSNEQMRTILGRMNQGGGRATISFVFDLLREAMLANNYLASHTYVFRTILPEEKWEDWKKLNERVVVEAAPLPIDDFLDEVEEPTDAELAEFFDEYKDREPTTEVLTQYGNVELPSATPAFATPPRLKLAYLKADFNVVAENLMGEITDEEIAAYYEENKESFEEADSNLFGDDSLFGPDDLLSGDSEAPAEEEAMPSDEAAPTTEESPASEEMTEEPAPEAESVEPTEPESADTTEDPQGEPTEEPVAEIEPEDEPVNPLREEPQAETPGEPSVEPTIEEEEEEESSDNEAAGNDDKVYQPLEEVADEIRRRLANERAAERLQQKMDRIKADLDDAYVQYFDARLDAETDDDASVEPEPPAELADLKPIAEEEQLELVEVDQASQFELRDAEIGSSVALDSAAGRPLPAWFLLFRSDDVDLYQPTLTYDIDGNRYLVLVTKRYDAETPKLEDIRDDVLAAWKRVKAAELALAKAEELGETITPTGKSLDDYFGEQGDDAVVAADQIVETDPFAFLTIGQIAPSAQQVPLRLSQPQPLVAPGPELLEGVFDLEAGQVGAELNHDHTIAYVLRIAQRIGTEDELRREFLRDGDRWLGASTLMQARATSKVTALLGSLMDESGLEWARDPDQLR